MADHNNDNVESPHLRRATVFYLAVWKVVVYFTMALGTVVALVAYGPLPAALVFGSSVSMCAMWVYVFTLDDHWGIRRVLRLGLVAGLAVTATAGLSTLVHGWALGIVVVLSAGSPHVLKWLRITQSGPRTDPAGRSGPTPSEGLTNIRKQPQELDDAELCRAWRDTGQALSRRHSTRATLELVEYRVRCLDDIERRNPKASRDWLLDGPPLGVDARSYLPPGIHGRSY